MQRQRSNNILLTVGISTILIAIYFAMSWFYPWPALPWFPAISTAYLWDLSFSVMLLGLLKLKSKSKKRKDRTKEKTGFLVRLIAVLLLGVASLFILEHFAFAVPFRYIESPVLQLLIFAPIFEELVFRLGFLTFFLRFTSDKRYAILLSSLLFAVSHLSALWHLPKEFHAFVGIQFVYTFFLGWLLGKSFDKTGSVLFPIVYHFLFNLIFYLGMRSGHI